MPRFRVLIVDDSAVIRKLLSDVLASDAELEVVGTAPNGGLALARIAEVKPDLITLDLEMPGMDGLTTVTEIRKLYPSLPVIMFSSYTERGAIATLDALARGASDYVTKPSSGSSELARQCVRDELIPKIKVLCGGGVTAPRLTPVAVRAALRGPAPIDIVAIGASTGGPNALAEVIPRFPANFPVPVVIVQHMPALFTRLFAERMRAVAKLPVREGEDGQPLLGGQIWIAPGGFHMTVVRKGPLPTLALTEDPPENSCRPAVDVLFRSVAQAYGANVLAAVLTGMGWDGTQGARTIRDAGGEVFVQDEASAVVWGMPGHVVEAGLANRICPLSDMAGEIERRVMARRPAENGVQAVSTT